jgi:hypothetical protein
MWEFISCLKTQFWEILIAQTGDSTKGMGATEMAGQLVQSLRKGHYDEDGMV